MRFTRITEPNCGTFGNAVFESFQGRLLTVRQIWDDFLNAELIRFQKTIN